MTYGDKIIRDRLAAMRDKTGYYYQGQRLTKRADILALPRPRSATLEWPPR